MKPGEIVYDFSKIEKSESAQRLLKLRAPSSGPAVKIDIEDCKEGMREFSRHFIRSRRQS